MPSYGPFVADSAKSYSSHNVNELTQSYVYGFISVSTLLTTRSSLFDRKNLLVACDPKFGKYMTAATIFRGNISSREVSHLLELNPQSVAHTLLGRSESPSSGMKESLFLHFLQSRILSIRCKPETPISSLSKHLPPVFTSYLTFAVVVGVRVCSKLWYWLSTGIPDNVSIGLCSVPPVGQKQVSIFLRGSCCSNMHYQSATCLGNSTAIQEVWKRSLSQYTAMYKRKAFMHWYTGEGMDEMEFSEAENNTLDLMSVFDYFQVSCPNYTCP